MAHQVLEDGEKNASARVALKSLLRHNPNIIGRVAAAGTLGGLSGAAVGAYRADPEDRLRSALKWASIGGIGLAGATGAASLMQGYAARGKKAVQLWRGRSSRAVENLRAAKTDLASENSRWKFLRDKTNSLSVLADNKGRQLRALKTQLDPYRDLYDNPKLSPRQISREIGERIRAQEKLSVSLPEYEALLAPALKKHASVKGAIKGFLRHHPRVISKSVVGGGVLGALPGAAIGASLADPEDRLRGTLLGAAIGGVGMSAALLPANLLSRNYHRKQGILRALKNRAGRASRDTKDTLGIKIPDAREYTDSAREYLQRYKDRLGDLDSQLTSAKEQLVALERSRLPIPAIDLRPRITTLNKDVILPKNPGVPILERLRMSGASSFPGPRRRGA